MKWRYRVQRVGNPTEVTVRHKPHRNGCAGQKALPLLKEKGVDLPTRSLIRVEAGNRVVVFFELNGRGNLMPMVWR